MNAKSIIASVSLLIAAGAAFAAPTDNEATFDSAFRNQGVSTLTREQVKSEAIVALKSGALDRNEATDDIAFQAPRSKTPEVKAQLAAKAVKGTAQQ
jgi:hypothetical protein